MSEETKDDPSRSLSKEERMAAKLRENLRRRKAQARASDSDDAAPVLNGVSKPESNG